MDIAAIKELAQKYTQKELLAYADELEQFGSCKVTTKTDPDAVMSDLLQAAEVRGLVDNGMSLQEAVREFSKRVRGVISK